MPKKFGRFNPLANSGKAVVGDVDVIEPEPEPEPIPGEQSEFTAITINTVEANRYKSGLLQTRKIDATKIAKGTVGSRAQKSLDVRKQKKEYYFVYEKRHLDWWTSEKQCKKKGSKGRKGRVSVSEIVDVWLDEGKKNNRFQIKVKADDDEPEGTYQFYAPTKEDQEEWVFFIKEAFDAYQAEATQKRGRSELKQIYERESVGVVQQDFAGLVKTFNGCVQKLNQTYAMKLRDRQEYAEDDESLEMLQSFVMGTVAVTRELQEDIAELQDKLKLLTMGHDEREMAAVVKMQRNFRVRQAKKVAQGKMHAIVDIQSCYRGYMVRSAEKERHEAATLIQSAFRNKSMSKSTRAAARIQKAYRRYRAAALVRGVGSALAQDGAAALWNSIVDSSGSALFFCRLCGSPLDAVAPRRVCGVCSFTEMAAFNCREVDEADPSALQGEAAVQEQAIKAIAASPNWIEALKNLVFFFVANERGFEGLGLEASKAEDLLSAHGLELPEPWLKSLITTACEEMEHRHHPFRKQLYGSQEDGKMQMDPYRIADDI